MYKKSKLYLDTLNKFEEFILWCYTSGSLARLINNFLLKDEKYEYFIEQKMTSYAIFFQIKWYLLYKIDIIPDIQENNQLIKFKEIFNNIIIYIWTNIKSINKFLRKEYTFDKNDDKILTELVSYINNNSHIRDLNKKIDGLSKFFTKYTENIIIECIIKYIIEGNNNILIDYLELNLSILKKILDNTPPIDKCIRLYKIIGRNSDLYEIGKQYKQNVINSVSCSRSANISIFYDRDKNMCCLLDIICKPGTKVLFLNYDKTAYGNKMYEVLLPIGYNFNILSSDMKSIVTYNFISKDIIIKDYSQVKPIFDIKYINPSVNKIKTYLIEVI